MWKGNDVNEDKPAVEFAADADQDESSNSNWIGLGGVALIAGIAAIVIAWPGFWEDEVLDASGRRGRIISTVLGSIGFVPTLTILIGIAVIAAVFAAIDLKKALRREGD